MLGALTLLPQTTLIGGFLRPLLPMLWVTITAIDTSYGAYFIPTLQAYTVKLYFHIFAALQDIMSLRSCTSGILIC